MNDMDLLLIFSPILGVSTYYVGVFIYNVICLFGAIITMWAANDDEDEHN